ncbi:MAG: CxxxxCH/CxxCH domain-containing protein [Geobacter sp.]|nr:CxxxxCH/CxxCH domain-containing protein [Geobacter sp.]
MCMKNLRSVGWLFILTFVCSFVMQHAVGSDALAAPQYNFTCSSCHSMPPIDATSRDPNTGGFVGSHQTHQPAGAVIENCAVCHNASGYTTSHMNGQISFKKTINGSPKAGATYTSAGLTDAGTYTFKNQTSVPTLGSCTNVNCHFEATTPTWGGTLYSYTSSTVNDCDQCHGMPPAGTSPSFSGGAAGSHGKHDSYYSGAANCVKCHIDHLAEGSKFAHATSAGNRGLIVTVKDPANIAGGSYSGAVNDYLPSQTNAFGSCSNLYCHSDGTKASGTFTAKTTATWGGSVTCQSCHGYDISAGANAMSSGVHTQHINNTGNVGRAIACQECHAATTTNGTSISTVANHVDKNVNVKFDNLYNLNTDNPTYNGSSTTGTAGAVKAPGSAVGSCSNVYCHSNGNISGTTPSYKTIAWNAAAIGCDGCHGGSGASYPTYVSGAAGSTTANSHLIHVQGKGLACDSCHTTTVSGSTTLINNGSHLNRIENVDFATFGGATGTYNASKQCSNTYCHSNGASGAALVTAQWGGQLDCRGCHGGDAAHSNVINTNKHRIHVDPSAAGSILGTGTGFQCAACHVKTINTFANNTTITGPALHVNTLKDYSGARAGKIIATAQCANVYCHSSGAKAPTFRNMTGSKLWTGSGTVTCKSCHGYGPGAFTSSLGEPNYVNGGIGSTTANNHDKHVSGAGLTNTTQCAACHDHTVDAAVANKLKNYTTQHLDGTRDVIFSAKVSGSYTAASQTCNNTKCHGSGNPQWGGSALACNACHGASFTSFSSATKKGAHKQHYETNTYSTYAQAPGNYGSSSAYQFACASCHATPAAHADLTYPTSYGVAQVYFGYTSAGKKPSYNYGAATAGTDSGTFTWTAGGSTSCNNTYCHSNGRGGAGATAVTWASGEGSLGTQCAGCHGNASSDTLSGRHNSHVNNAGYLGTNFGCVDCHAKTVSGNLTLADKRQHVNKFRDYSGLRAGRQANFNSATGSCSGIYCHSDGKGTTVVTPSWTAAAAPLACNACHANTSLSHPKHLALATITCASCHSNTAASSSALAPGTRTHINGTYSVNKIDVRFAAFGGYTGSFRADKTCSNTYCHGASPSPAWGTTNLACNACHANQGAGTQTAAYTVPHLKHTNVAGYKFACDNCHTVKSATNTTHAGGQVSANQFAQVVFNTGAFSTWSTTTYGGDTANRVRFRAMNQNPYGASATPVYVAGGTSVGADNGFSWTAGTCSNVWCHSNAAPVGGTNTYQASLTWSGTLGCTACHGGSSGTGGTGLSAVHGKHISGGAGQFSYTCDKCHVNTVAAGTSSSLNASSGLQYHLNAAKDVNFDTFNPGSTYTAASYTCSTNYCHSNGKGVYASPQWNTASTGACGTCHATTPAIGGSLISSNAHFEHFSTSYGPKLTAATVAGCQQCHTYTGENAVTHVDKAIEAPLATCTTNCHKQMASIQWNNSRVACESCHTGALSVINGVTAPDKSPFATWGHGKISFGLPGKACSDCHNPDSRHISGVLGDTNRTIAGLGDGTTNVACTYCHNDPTKVTNARFRNMSTHSSSYPDGPQDMACRECHDPHGATNNLSMIRGSINFINTTTWVITYTNRDTGWINTTSNRGLCQVCHTKTKYYRAGRAESSHPTTNCYSCHTHNAQGGAFRASGACDSCHGYPPVPRNIAGLTFGTMGNYSSARFEDYSGGGGAHTVAAHVPPTVKATDGWSSTCTSCHFGGESTHKRIIPVRSNVANISVQPKPSYKRFNPAILNVYTGAKRLNPPANETGTCYNISCHFQKSPKWSNIK